MRRSAPLTTWPGAKGSVGGAADPATGLTNMGAREYNAATASFISSSYAILTRTTQRPQSLHLRRRQPRHQ